LADSADGLICLHPFVSPGTAGFRVYAEPDAGYALTGEIDAASGDLFATMVQRTWPLTGDETLVVDAQQLQFIGHRQLVGLDRYARAHHRKVVLRTGQPIPIRLAGLLDLTNVEVTPPPTTGC
jgi:anti-anti-sigma regulatory factor